MNRYLIAVACTAAAGVMVAPAAAMATGEPIHSGGGLVALGQPGKVGIRPGETVPVTIGVWDNTNITVSDGLVLNVTVAGDLSLPRTFGNCWYYVNGDVEGAWCLVDGRVQSGAPYVYEASPFTVSADRSAHADKIGDIVLSWDWRSAGADMADLKNTATGSAGTGTTLVRGSSSQSLKLIETSRLVPALGSDTCSVHMRLDAPHSSPTAPNPGNDEPAVTSTAKPGRTSPAAPGSATPVVPSPAGGPAGVPHSLLGTLPTGGQYTRVTAEQASEALTSAGAPRTSVDLASDEQLAKTDSNPSFGAIFGTGCFLLAAGLIISQFVVRRRRRFVA